ncbi:bZIP transcription factor family protein [Actinidia rufa]|uniref:BZIP transcription factor family protein n=1 Tax=Actinidia rufa TaxID=165716 RepID=A0A7J0F8V6_9ERIC|nr:bZIP transcription factor family protein [Actinidia rufa]
MGGNNRQQKKSSSPFSFFTMFKSKRYSSKVVEDNSWDDSVKYYKVWPSDEDRGRYVAEPGIDRKASAYIAKIRTQCVADHDFQASN